MQTLALKIDLSKIDRNRIFQGKNGAKYLDAIVFVKDETDQYGNQGMVVESISKEEKAAGVKGTILGNVKLIGGANRTQPQQQSYRPDSITKADPNDPLSSLPF